MREDLSHLNKHLTRLLPRMTPPGIYPATILAASVERSKNGKPQIVYKLEVEVKDPSGFHKALIFKFTQLIEPMIEFFLDDMAVLEITLTDMDQVPEALASVIGAIVETEVAYNPGYQYPVPKFLRLVCKPRENCGYF